ncbi:MAG: glutamate--tRNA ligase [Candidatus Marinimicrobia bacterium]|nr:glutamate--tRNA ligase [Candidatus Neomarinimicrobiota bacterium]MCF7829052.1 glutamate--tRNA ligase [Candidatus Neomarinimicrobiota bacterium]MCF7881811.1 glutamate--tRNA ligase [Candidatus Neomarinimicrobiota bacterium]
MKGVKVRFAPSPTGFLHVGGLRTAYYNYLYAKKQGGTFVLRIEDTDQTRLVKGAVENLIETLHWAGIEYDEGPELSKKDSRGENGPYRQSERLDIYTEYVNQLVENDYAYHCFCSQERLEKVRKQQQEMNRRSQYDKHCRKLSKEERMSRLDAGMPHVIRMKIPEDDGTVEFSDKVRGEVAIPHENLDDQILMKSDGFPTYHMANVVDDHLMGITHVIRGEEWLPSTPKHILLYEYFDWEPPVFAHLPLLLNEDRSKLSKRQGDVAVEDYREKGYLPEALTNFVALLGWSPGDDEEILSTKELIRKFSLDRINKSGAVFNVEKLQWMNGMYIRETETDRLVDLAQPFLEEAGFDTGNRRKMTLIIDAVKENLRYLAEIPEVTEVFQPTPLNIDTEAEPELGEMLAKDSSKQVFAALADQFEEQEEITKDTFMAIMKSVQKDTGVKGKDLWMPVRIALTGEMHGPELPAVIEILGKDLCIKRFRDQLG